MKTHQERIEYVRQKCIEANSSALKWVEHSETLVVNRAKKVRKWSIINREPRLADVLLAGTDKFWGKNVLDLVAMYDLKNDDLTKQSEETIVFLFELLQS